MLTQTAARLLCTVPGGQQHHRGSPLKALQEYQESRVEAREASGFARLKHFEASKGKVMALS